MSSTLKSSIIRDFESSFIQNCLVLWGEAFNFIKENKTITTDWEEENISALFFDHIDKSQHSYELKISIFNEFRLYDNLILSGEKSAKTASRIDFRLSTWCEQRNRSEFFIETKNLIEEDCFKISRNTKILANKLHKRYVETGIDHFISGKYPSRGCMVGYVLEGIPVNIVLMINSYMANHNRIMESLSRIPTGIPALEYAFCSIHGKFLLKHYLLKF